MVIFSGLTTNPDIANAGDYIFRTALSDIQVGTDTGNVLWADGIRRLATITEATDYAEGVRRTSVAQFEKRGGQVVSEERYNSDVTDFRTQLTKLLNEAPDALHIAAQSEFTAGTIVKQARELGYEGPIYGEAVTAGATALEIAGDAATGSVRTQSASRVASSKPRRGAAHDLPALSIDVYLQEAAPHLAWLPDFLLPSMSASLQPTHWFALQRSPVPYRHRVARRPLASALQARISRSR